MARAVVIAILALVAVAACGDTQLRTTQANVPLPAGKTASFDDVEIDQIAQTVYAADRANSGVDVFDVSGSQPRFVTTIALPAPPNGLAIDTAGHRVYAGTASGAIEVIDATDRKLLPPIKTPAQEIDLLDFAPGPNWLLAGTGGGGGVLTIDATSGKIVATADVGKPVEQPRYDAGSGKVYVSVPDLDSIAAIAPNTGAVTDMLKLGGCIPVGMAIRASTGTAVIACRKSVIAYDLRSGNKTDLGPRVAGGDVVHYFPAIDRFFVDSSHTVPSVVGMYGGDPVSAQGSVTVDSAGNAVVYEARNDTVYTTDSHAATGGLTGFRMDGTRPVPVVQTALFTIGPFALLVLLVGAVWWLAGRHADPIHRRQAPVPTPAPALAKPRDQGRIRPD